MACTSEFGFACVAFFFAALVLVPLTGALSEAFHLSDVIPMVLIMLQLFGLPVVPAIIGVSRAARSIGQANQASLR